MNGASRWEQLFDDLEALAEADDRAAFDAEVADRVRAEHAALSLSDRLAGQIGGAPICVWLPEGESVRAVVQGVGEQWVMLDAGGPLLVPLAAVVAVSGLARRAQTADGGPLRRRLPLTVVLRALARDRAPVRLQLRAGLRPEGTIDAVAVDHLDLAEHPVDEPRRAAAVRGVLSVHLAAIVCVRVTPG